MRHALKNVKFRNYYDHGFLKILLLLSKIPINTQTSQESVHLAQKRKSSIKKVSIDSVESFLMSVF